MVRLSTNFTLQEFTKSQTALRQGIDNTPGEDHLVNAKLLDSSIVFVDQFTDKNKTVHDKTTMFVYDMYGRGWIMDVKDESTVLSFDGTEMVVNQASVFKTASKAVLPVFPEYLRKYSDKELMETVLNNACIVKYR